MSSSALPPTAPLDRLSSIVSGLVRVVWSKREYGFFTALVVQTICARIGRARQELQTLMAAFRAGTLRTRRSPAPGLTRKKPRARTATDTPDPLRLVTVPLPRAFGWLVKILAWQVTPFMGALEQFLEDPEMQALFAASPRAVRAVRPLCWMLGVRMPKPPAPVPPAPVRPGPATTRERETAPRVAVAAPCADAAPDAGRRAATHNELDSNSEKFASGTPGFCTP